ncbi:MAG: hypothetical protein AB1444_00785 [Spirochaetota bacterium]
MSIVCTSLRAQRGSLNTIKNGIASSLAPRNDRKAKVFAKTLLLRWPHSTIHFTF